MEVIPYIGTNFGTLSTSISKETETLISIIMVHIFLWGTLGNELEVVHHLGMDFGTLGTSLRKFGTFNPRATGTFISLFMVHLFH